MPSPPIKQRHDRWSPPACRCRGHAQVGAAVGVGADVVAERRFRPAARRPRRSPGSRPGAASARTRADRPPFDDREAVSIVRRRPVPARAPAAGRRCRSAPRAAAASCRPRRTRARLRSSSAWKKATAVASSPIESSATASAWRAERSAASFCSAWKWSTSLARTSSAISTEPTATRATATRPR